MAQREGSVYLYLFIVAAVLFVLMTVMFFINNAEKQEVLLARDMLDRKVKAEVEARKKLNGELNSLKELIVGPKWEEWTDTAQLVTSVRNDELKGKAEKTVNDTKQSLKETPASYTYLIEPFADLPNLLMRLNQTREEAIANWKKVSDGEAALKKTSDDLSGRFQQDLQTAQQATRDLEAKYEDLDNKAKTKEADLVAQLESVREEGITETTRLKRIINLKDNEVRSLQQKIAQIQEQMQREQDIESIEPDAKIVYVLATSGKAWVDLGRADHLQNGLRFRVFQTLKGGKRKIKGSIEIQKIEEKMSEVRIVEQLDEMDPIVAGDFISSPFYDRSARPVFVFAGTELESKDVTKELLVAKMQQYGATISKDVNEKTDFLVAMKDYQTTPEYKTAKELQVKIIRERDLLDFLGY